MFVKRMQGRSSSVRSSADVVIQRHTETRMGKPNSLPDRHDPSSCCAASPSSTRQFLDDALCGPLVRLTRQAMRMALPSSRIVLDRPRLWRGTAGLAAVLFLVLLAGAAQGSIDVIARHPTTSGAPWERWCTAGKVREDRRRLAFCARIDGRALASTHGPGVGEVHVAVVGGFHLTIVRLPDGSPTPSLGTRVVAVGPLVRARNGQREVQAFKVLRG
jgi:hypothetical protein